MDQIIEPASGTDHRVAQGSPVDGAVGPDLDIGPDHHPPQVGHGAQSPGAGGQAKAVLADAHAGVQERSGANQGVAERAGRADAAVRSHHHAGLEHGVGADAAARSDHHALADIGERANLDRAVDQGALSHETGRMAPRANRRRRMEHPHDLAPGLARRGDHDRRRAHRHAAGHVRLHDHGAGGGVVQQMAIAGAGQEADIGWPGRLQRRHAGHQQVGWRAAAMHGVGHLRDAEGTTALIETGVAQIAVRHGSAPVEVGLPRMFPPSRRRPPHGGVGDPPHFPLDRRN